MRSLLWSEWRSKRLWGLALAASVIVPILFGDPLTFWSEFTSISSNALLACMIVALLFGAMAFTGELGSGTQDFLMSRPVSWKKLLAAKLIVGLGLLMGTGLLAALTFRLVCPAPYLPFLTSSRIAAGLAGAAVVMVVPYLVGMTCSVVLPGALGSILMMLVIAVTATVEAVLVVQRAVGMSQLPVIVLSWMCGLTIAALVIVRFGLTLSLAQRIRRYAFVLLGCVVSLSVTGLVLYQPKPVIVTLNIYNFSPDLSNALVLTESITRSAPSDNVGRKVLDSFSSNHFWRTTDGLKRDIGLPPFDIYSVQWLDNGTAFCIQSSFWPNPSHAGLAPAPRRASVRTIRLDKSGKPAIKEIELGYNIYVDRRLRILSDTGVIPLISEDRRIPDSTPRLRFFDIKAGKWLQPTAPCGRGWWQSNTEYAWLDEKDNLHTIQVR